MTAGAAVTVSPGLAATFVMPLTEPSQKAKLTTMCPLPKVK